MSRNCGHYKGLQYRPGQPLRQLARSVPTIRTGVRSACSQPLGGDHSFHRRSGVVEADDPAFELRRFGHRVEDGAELADVGMQQVEPAVVLVGIYDQLVVD